MGDRMIEGLIVAAALVGAIAYLIWTWGFRKQKGSCGKKLWM
jgi:hypothetical protein